MAIKTKKTGFALAATAALLISGCASTEKQPEAAANSGSEMGQCSGVNSCKGTGSCATASSSCAGQNACKGKGWLPLNKAECESRGGKFSGFKK